MKQLHTKSLLFSLIALASVVVTAGQSRAEINASRIFVLSPNHASATYDFYNYTPTASAKDAAYFLVLFAGLQTTIQTLNVKLSTSPVFTSYEGSVSYVLFGLGYPNIMCGKQVKATYSTVASNYISASFDVNAQYGFAILGAALVERHDVSSDVKMSFKVSIDY